MRSDASRTHQCQHCGAVYEPVKRWQRFYQPSCRRQAFTGRPAQPRLLPPDPDDLFRTPFE